MDGRVRAHLPKHLQIRNVGATVQGPSHTLWACLSCRGREQVIEQ